MPPAPIVRLDQVAKRFGDGPLVIDGLNLTVEDGEFVSLIGPSGCGKSTVLRLVAGLSPASGGNVTVGGSAPETSSVEVAFVFQDPALLPWLNVFQNAALPLGLRGRPAEECRAAAARTLALVGLADRPKAYPRQLSGGQKMRVSLARALTLSPRLLLLDEPFGALDEMTRQRLNEELLALRERQRWTALFVTHSVAEAVFLSDRVVVLAPPSGRVQAEIAIPLPKPRTAETRLSPAYLDLVVEVSRRLREAAPEPSPA
jgi:NitT/TauT family transport system ATP-binding protein